MRRYIFLYTVITGWLAAAELPAQMPVMKTSDKNIPDASITLERMNIEVEVFGNIAVTTMTMDFRNHTTRILEGELTFPMPEGVTVSGYAIDIDGRLRDAVPVPADRATEVFESIERRNVDPGLLERVGGNNFRSRIYPLNAGKIRTVRVSYEETLQFRNSREMQYRLPLKYPQSIASFSLRMKVYNAVLRPRLVEQPDHSFSFAGYEHIYEASMHKNGFRPNSALTVNLPKDMRVPEVILQKNTDGSSYFLINACQQQDGGKAKTWSNTLGVIWDSSLSGLQRDREKELDLLGKIISHKQNLTVELGLLNISYRKARTFIIKNGDWSELKTYLLNVVYDGGTDFSKLDDREFSAGEYLFFTEGMSTFGDGSVSIRRPVHCIASSLQADYSALKALGSRTGGKFVNLSASSVDEAFGQLSQNDLHFLGIEEKNAVSEVYPSIPTEVNGHISVAGIVRAGQKELTLLFGRNGNVTVKQKTKLKHTASDVDIYRVWAQKKIAELDVNYDRHRDEIERLGKQFGLVTRNTSLIVLENVTDYVRYEITPPDELLDEYNSLAKARRLEKEERINDLLERSVAMTDDLKAWWNTDFTRKKKYPQPEKERRAVPSSDELASSEDVSSARPRQGYVAPTVVEEMEIVEISAEPPPPPLYRETAYRRNKNQMLSADGKPAQSGITIPDIKVDRDYIRRLEAASDPYATYLVLRETYAETPAFFFDASNFFYSRGQDDKGLLILSCLADLAPENAELFRTLAYKLKERGEYAAELFITGKIKEWRPMDAQSHRDHALALQDNARWQEALDCLYGVLTKSYTPEAAERIAGIEEIIVCEINNLVSRHGSRLNLDEINPKILAGLPVDIRVVINWNKDNTDIDLWVTDPDGEKCDYNHNRTETGGRLSRDFTRGYGPEQFLLKKAIDGKYTIMTNFFGETQLTLSGPTTIMAEIFLYYSSGREERRLITFQDSSAVGRGGKGVLIGEFSFEDTPVTAVQTEQSEHSHIMHKTASPLGNPYVWGVGMGVIVFFLITRKEQDRL
ncbi:MAG: hypothetical protein LBS42_05620 [Tannerella sp.]|jgi:hypothetical protein|nr:hypothetical protein [Tannerella sp.]